MKTRSKIGIGLLLTGTFLVSCETDVDPPPVDYQSEYIGIWDCNERTGIHSPQFYEVNITAGPTENTIIINNLYQTGTSIEATINGGFSLDIPRQTSENIGFEGSGSANSDFGQVNLNFTADDGSALQDEVEAVLVR